MQSYVPSTFAWPHMSNIHKGKGEKCRFTDTCHSFLGDLM
jgi:hypothetical protein